MTTRPRRFVRVTAYASSDGHPLGFLAVECDRHGEVTRRLTPGTGPGRPTKALATQDARDSQLPEWQP